MGGIKRLVDKLKNCLICIGYHSVIPLTPIFAELLFNHSLSTVTITLVAALYSITVASNSVTRDSTMFLLLTGFLLAVIFGALLQEQYSALHQKKGA